jgi:probable HAF family extracellular repeat protein
MPRSIIAIGTLAGASSAIGQLANIEYVGIVQPTSFDSFAYAIDDEGQYVAGTSGFLDAQAFRWSRSAGISGLGFLPYGHLSEGRGISGDGRVVVGECMTVESLDWEAFRWTEAGGMEALGSLDPSRPEGRALDANHDGSVIVGYADSVNSPGGSEAFVWTEGSGMVGLGDLPGGALASAAVAITPDGAVIAGTGTTERGVEAFRWTSATGMVGLGALPGDTHSGAAAMSHDGRAIVGASGARIFIWTDGSGMAPIELFDEGEMYATGMDGDGGVVVGNWEWVRNHVQDGKPFVWTRRFGTRELGDLLESRYAFVFPPGWTLWQAWDVSRDGRTIVGAARTPYEVQGFVLRLRSPMDCYGDFFPDGNRNVYDYIEFLDDFTIGSPDADCDQNNRLDLHDFLCFQDAFAEGC